MTAMIATTLVAGSAVTRIVAAVSLAIALPVAIAAAAVTASAFVAPAAASRRLASSIRHPTRIAAGCVPATRRSPAARTKNRLDTTGM